MRRRIDPTADRAMFRQLADILREAITSGGWAPGRNLPSEADLGHEHHVSQATVRRALAVLRMEGLIESVPGTLWRVQERGELTVVHMHRGDRVRARLATREDQERHGIAEGTPVLVIIRADGRDEVYRADEAVGEVPGPEPP